MDVQSKTPSKGRGRVMKKPERISQEEMLKKILDDHKKSLGDVVWVRIDDRTHIELPANMSEADRNERIENYLKNSNFKPAKRL
ncbi:hypothetical protein [Dysgonomonas sp. BGC7]|uniref:hypothetical protein n=1 Tax=Dysgonomonas sp. BGC7 TaxID=1658008 RepID=UPI000681946D|nr:hypothetical protein [Dysgonomonas sp. BGC7]MBD8389297.1 hypothetical protein [Dysgonomonas sp. BGC7]